MMPAAVRALVSLCLLSAALAAAPYDNLKFAFIAKAFRATKHNSVEEGDVDPNLPNIALGKTAIVSGSAPGHDSTFFE